MSKESERRHWPRGAHEDQIIVKVISSTSDRLPAGKTIPCRTTDVSRHGIRLYLSHELPSDTVLELWVIPLQRRGTLVLTGDVRWCKASRDGQTLWAGVEIRGESTTDFKEWEIMVSEIVPVPEA